MPAKKEPLLSEVMVQEMFSKDPEELTDEELDSLILELRMDRARYAEAERKTVNTKKKDFLNEPP